MSNEQERAAFEAWFADFRHGWKTEKDVAFDAFKAGAALAATPAPAEPATLSPIARRRVFDAIRGAYELGFADHKAGSFAAKEVETDHGEALIAALERALAATPAPEPQPLTDAEIDMATDHLYCDGRPVPAKYRIALGRIVERLAGQGKEASK